ncbi:uncharacterized protein [Rutidosis leptorrhynchoides]|uniref:uncharacterized protein n=1 Tax=Rutidosis leptorrhynchoides TaxID=125765 RepID=UPI003A993ABE
MGCVRESVGRERARQNCYKAGYDFKQERFKGRLQSDFPRLGRNRWTSFMFFNFPESWNMENLWRIFKAYGNLRDIYMVQKRLQNGQRFAFARFGEVGDVNRLLGALEKIKFDGFPIRIFKAFDKPSEGRKTHGGKWPHGDSRYMNYEDNRKGWNGSHRADTYTDGRDFNDFAGPAGKDLRFTINRNKEDLRVKLKSNIEKKEKVASDEFDRKKDKTGKPELNKEETDERSVPIRKDDCNLDIIDKSIVVQLKRVDLLNRFESLCRAEGMEDFSIKYVGGLEAMVICKSSEYADNIVNSKSHAIHKWCDKVEKLKLNYWPLAGRMVWIDINGVPITCWNEGVFYEIAAKWGKVIEMENCSLTSENQNLITCHVLIHKGDSDHVHGLASIVIDNLTFIHASVRENPNRVIHLEINCPSDEGEQSDDEVNNLKKEGINYSDEDDFVDDTFASSDDDSTIDDASPPVCQSDRNPNRKERPLEDEGSGCEGVNNFQEDIKDAVQEDNYLIKIT